MGQLKGVRRIHLIGIGGVGMSGLAVLLKENGFFVQGSDIKLSYNTSFLERLGIKVFLGHTANHIEEADLVCFSSAIKGDNVEIREAKKRGIPLVERGKLLAYLTENFSTIVISGSHGKTTTSALTAFVLRKLGFMPNAFIGAITLNFDSYAWKGENIFVVEADESDGSFLFHWPWVTIITNIDCEHLDFYYSIEELKSSFRQLSDKTKGVIIGWGDDQNVLEVVKGKPSILYGLGDKNQIRAERISIEGMNTKFEMVIDGDRRYKVTIPLIGRHNVLNTLAVISLAKYMGLSIEKVISVLQEFKGTKRRFQIKTTVGGVTFVDDYAHHPREIEAVLEAASFLPFLRKVVVFQPHRYTRVKMLHTQFARCFGRADVLIITDIYPASEKPIVGIDGKFLYKEIRRRFFKQVIYLPRNTLVEVVPTIVRRGDLVLGLGAGDINRIMDEVVKKFKQSLISEFSVYETQSQHN